MFTPFLLLVLASLAIAGGAWCLLAAAVGLAIGDAWREVAAPGDVFRAIVLLLLVGLVLFAGGAVAGAGMLA